LKDDELMKMFGSMLGISDPDPNIVLPKYDLMIKNSEDIISILKGFITKSPCTKVFYNDFMVGFDDVNKFNNNASQIIQSLHLQYNDKILTGADLNKLNSSQDRIEDLMKDMTLQYKITNLREQYNKLKECYTIREIVMIARNIKSALMLEKEE